MDSLPALEQVLSSVFMNMTSCASVIFIRTSVVCFNIHHIQSCTHYLSRFFMIYDLQVSFHFDALFHFQESEFLLAYNFSVEKFKNPFSNFCLYKRFPYWLSSFSICSSSMSIPYSLAASSTSKYQFFSWPESLWLTSTCLASLHLPDDMRLWSSINLL